MESISSTRDIIKNRVPASFVFLDQQKNIVCKADEADYKLEDIINEKIIKLQTEDNNTNNPSEQSDPNSLNINICDGKEKICSINSNIKIQLDQARKMINNKLKDEFIFLDLDNNDIEKNDENDFCIEDILKEDTIKIRLKKKEKPKRKNIIEYY